MCLGIEVDAPRPFPASRDTGEKVQCRRGLADTAFLIEYGDDRHDRVLFYREWPRAPCSQITRLRTCVTASSAITTTTKMAARINATRRHWNRFSAESSAM